MATEEPGREEPSFFDISLDKLDKDWVTHPGTVYKYALLAVDARDARDRAAARLEVAEDDLERVAAEVELDVRKRPEQYGLDKTTEAVVKAAVLLDLRYTNAQRAVYDARRKLNKAKHDVGVYEAALKALDHRRDGLEAAGMLWKASYFASPRVDADTRREAADERITKALSKRRVRDPD